MKKWLDEAAASCGYQNKYCNKDDSGNNLENSDYTDREVKSCKFDSSKMGLGVSSEVTPETRVHSEVTEESISEESYSSVPTDRIKVASLCHYSPSSVKTNEPTLLTAQQTTRLMSLTPQNIGYYSAKTQFNNQPTCSSQNSSEASSNESIIQDMNAISLQLQNKCTLTHKSSSLLTISQTQNSPSCSSNQILNSTELESHHEGISTNSDLYDDHIVSSESNYDITPLPSTSRTFCQQLPATASHTSSGIIPPTGCGHWCSACRVKVQVEVECVPSSQRSPNGNRRGMRPISFPKRTRHKIKAPTKDINCSHKKKKSPWSFRLNCRLRSNKNDNDQRSLLSSMGCASCVCPGYRRTETETTYRSVSEGASINNSSLQTPVIDFHRFSHDTQPLNDLEESARQERAREMTEGIDPPPGFIPIIGEKQNSLALPLTYNSMLDLQVLLESSLRLGLRGTRSNAYPVESSLMDAFPLASSLLSKTVHTQVDYIHCLVPDLLAITKCVFYWGKMDRYETERLLENRPEGTFLLRDSAQEEYLFSVSFRRYGRSLHARIEQWKHKFSFDSHDPGVFASDTVCGLIEHYKDPSCCMFFEPLLTNPLSRTFPFPLQHLCRATICSKVTYDGINNLELPKSFKNYLKEYHYKQRVRVRHLD